MFPIGLIDFAEKREPAGRAVIFCPICRDLRAVAASRFRREIVSLYILPLWRWDARTELTCADCKAEYRRSYDFACHPEAPENADPLDLLAHLDGERFDEINARLDLENRREERRLSHTEREHLIAEPFREFNHLAPKVSSAAIPTLTGICILGLVFALPIAYALLVYTSSWVAHLIAALVILLLVALIVIDRKYLDRYRRRSSPYALLARALAPLDPSDEELRQTLTTLRSEKLAIASRIRIAPLRRELDLALQAARPAAPAAWPTAITPHGA